MTTKSQTPQKEPLVAANLEAERQLLGKILLQNEVYWEVRDILKPEYFSAAPHQELFENIGLLLQEGKRANPVTLLGFGPADINSQPAQKYYVALAGDPTHMVSVSDYAMIIRNFAKRRRFAHLTGAASEYALKSTEPSGQDLYFNDLDARLLELKFEFDGKTTNNRSIEQVCDESLISFLKETATEGEIYPTIGLKDVTRLMGPLTPGCLYVLAGRPGSGKTAAVVAATRSILRQKAPNDQQFGVGFFSLEMTKKDIWARFVACEMALSSTPIYYMEIKRRTVPTTHLKAVEKNSDNLKKFALFIEDKSSLTVSDIYAFTRQEQHRFEQEGKKLHVIVIDYLQIIKPSKRYQGNKVAEISEISSGLVHLAKELNVAVLAVSQLSRKVEERNDKRPIMPDLRESGQIEQDSSGIVFLYRPAYYDEHKRVEADPEKLAEFEKRKNDLHYIVAKARDGIPGEAITYCDIGKNHIVDKSR